MKIVAFTGAGISKSAGIPTFEEIEGIKEKLSTEFKESNPKEFEEAINLLKTNVANKEPTKAHKILGLVDFDEEAYKAKKSMLMKANNKYSEECL